MEVFTTFWDIIKNQGIEIPPIQRDYAQGRSSEKVEKIRTKFIDSIHDKLFYNKSLRLDFIYGKIFGIRNEEEHHRNKQAIESLLRSVKDYASSIDLTFNELEISDKSTNIEDLIYLVPLDGQQRLTTLFLLHWYFVKRLNLVENMQVLKRFKYKTRKSSHSFTNLLCSEIKFDFIKPLDEEVIGLENFSNTWLDDPTVASMLVVLKAIHLKFGTESNETISLYWIRLTEEKKIFFDFLNLKDFNLSDELYVKMNARGKQLSEFENFKAWLFGEIERKQLIEQNELEKFKKQFDIEWNDIFWNSKKNNEFEIDTPYYNFFKLLFVYDILKIIELDETNFKESIELDIIQCIRNNNLFDFENKFNQLFFDNIPKYFKLLEICSNYDAKDTIFNEFFQFFFSKFGIKPNWNNLIGNYILYSYLIAKSKNLVEYTDKEFNDLMDYYRITKNLFNNSIIDNPSLYKSAVYEIDEITNFLNSNDFDISKWIELLEYKSKSVFPKHQLEEEILKYRLLSKNEEWKTAIHYAENITYFESQLNFWFYKCEMSITKLEYTDDFLEELFLNKFKEVTLKILKLFNQKGINREGDFSERIFERALLSKTDYLLNEGGYKCFGRDIGRDVSWKRLFLRDRNNQETNQALKEIFDLDFDNIKLSFQNFIDINQENYSVNNWRKAFVENKELFNYVGNQKYIRKIENHGWVIIMDQYKTYIGAHYELFSLNFFIKYLSSQTNEFSPFNKIDYNPAPKNNLDDLPCAYLNWETNDFIYALDIRYLEEKFNLRFFTKDFEIKVEVKIVLLTLGFKVIDNDFIIEFENEFKTLDLVKELAKQLSNL